MTKQPVYESFCVSVKVKIDPEWENHLILEDNDDGTFLVAGIMDSGCNGVIELQYFDLTKGFDPDSVQTPRDKGTFYLLGSDILRLAKFVRENVPRVEEPSNENEGTPQ